MKMLETMLVSGLPDRLLTTPMVLEMLPVTEMSLSRWMKNKGFPRPLRIGARSYWRLSEVCAWIEKQGREPGRRPGRASPTAPAGRSAHRKLVRARK